MPYIPRDNRPQFDWHIDALVNALSMHKIHPGEFNYCVSKLAWSMIERLGNNYTALNTIIGALECVKVECYRRIGSQLEDNAISRNGDII